MSRTPRNILRPSEQRTPQLKSSLRVVFCKKEGIEWDAMGRESARLGAKSGLAVASSDRDVASSVQVRYAARVEAQLAILRVLFT